MKTIQDAIRLIQGVVNGNVVIYFDHSTNSYWRNPTSDLEILVKYMNSEDEYTRANAYSLWCSATDAEEIGKKRPE